jgi:hypothetical protein
VNITALEEPGSPIEHIEGEQRVSLVINEQELRVLAVECLP